MDLENTKGSLLSDLHFDLRMNPVYYSYALQCYGSN